MPTFRRIAADEPIVAGQFFLDDQGHKWRLWRRPTRPQRLSGCTCNDQQLQLIGCDCDAADRECGTERPA